MLDEYVEEVRRKLSELPYVNEDVIAAYVYLSLGEKLSFDIDFLPFGSSKKSRQYIMVVVCYLNLKIA